LITFIIGLPVHNNILIVNNILNFYDLIFSKKTFFPEKHQIMDKQITIADSIINQTCKSA